MLTSLHRFRDAVRDVMGVLFFRKDVRTPMPPPPPLPPGVPPTPGPTPPGPTPAPAPHDDIQKHLADFVSHFSGKFIEKLGPGAKFQCVDLANAWLQKMGLNMFPGDAADFSFGTHPDGFFVANTPTNVPAPGDLVIWARSRTLPWGHVGIFHHGNVMSFVTFDQNWPYGSPAHLQGHSYVGVKGWLHPLANRIHWAP